MNLLQLDHLVFHDHLLPFLGVNDHLRLRRVCSDFKTIAEEFIDKKKIKSSREMITNFYERDNEYQIAENSECLETFTTGLPIRYRLRISSNDSADEISLYSELAQLFYTNFGNQITHLSIGHLGVPFGSNKIIQFFEQFPNIKHLVLDEVRPWVRWGQETDLEMVTEVEVPSNFSKLESFCIKTCYLSWERVHDREKSFGFITKLVEKCLKNLKILSLPFEQFLRDCDADQVINLACSCLFSENSSLKISDFDASFINLLLNSRTHLRVMRTRDAMVTSINEKVVSIKNPGIQSFTLELPNLEKLRFEKTYEEYLTQPIHLCSRWSTVTEIIVSADFEYGRWEDENPQGPELSFVWDYLFVGDFCWERLSKLDISMSDYEGKVESYPDTRSIASSCKNLKSIAIRYWEKRHVDLAKLWEGMPLLEEVRFSHCTGMGNDAFFGESKEDLSFLKLKDLKVLEIRNIDDMGITDALFRKILRHMPLKELLLSSDNLVCQQVVTMWMNSLLSGQFADTIERLNMDNLWTGDEGEQELNQLKRQFRSFSMV